MKNCPNCGQPLHNEAAFCQNCGTPAPQDSVPVDTPAFCSNCGERLTPDTKFCVNCGTPIEQESAPAEEIQAVSKPTVPGRKKKVIIGAIAAAVVVVAGVLVIPRLFSSPSKQFVSYQQDLFVDRALGALEESVDTVGSGAFSSDLMITAITDSAEINRYLEDSSVSLKVDLNRDTLLANGELTLMGSPILSGLLSYEKGTLGFYLPEIEDTYYTMNLSHTVGAITGRKVDLSVLALPEISGKEWRSLLESYLDIVYTVVNEENVTVQDGVPIFLPELGGSGMGICYTFQPRAEDVEAMLLKLAQTLREDETLRQLILKLINPDMLTAAFGSAIFNGYDLEEELDSALLSLADELEYNAADVGREVESSGFTWELYVEGNQVRMIRLFTDYSDTTLVYESQGAESDRRQEAFYVEAYGETQFLLTHSYTKNGSVSNGVISLTQPYGASLEMRYDMDSEKKSPLGIPQGSYRIYSDMLPVSIMLDVTQGQNNSVDHTFQIQGDSYVFNDAFSSLEVNINATDGSSAKAPNVPPYDISDFSYSEYYDLFQRLGASVEQDLIRNLEPLMDASYGW